MPELNNTNDSQKQQNDPHYWRSFEELQNDSGFKKIKENEFIEGVTKDFDPNTDLSGVSRRKFLALLGASAALAGAGCSDYRNKGEIIPYNKQPEEVTLGKPNYYASTCTGCEQSCGILIKTREGRPIKITGNPQHPVNKGKICSKGEASILNLYDPSRIQYPSKNSNGFLTEIMWSDADNAVASALLTAGSREIALITEQITSPTFQKLIDDFKAKYPSTKVYTVRQFNDSIRKSAWEKCYPGNKVPLIQWDKAKVIVALEGDFLGKEGNKVENNRLFVKNRNVDDLKNFSRLYAVEGNFSLTGLNADHRFRLRPDKQTEFVLALTQYLVSAKGVAFPVSLGGLSAVISKFDLNKFCDENGISFADISNMAADLVSNRGKAIVYAGNALSEKTHIAVNLLNEILGNTAVYNTESSSVEFSQPTSNSEFEALVNSLNAGRVAMVITLDSNPVYNLPEDLGLKDALKKAGLFVSLTEQMNETAYLSNYVLPINHNLESWGDAQTRTALYSVTQPVIAPLFNTRQKESILLHWLTGDLKNYNDRNYYEYLKDNWSSSVFKKSMSLASFEKYWLGSLHDGYTVFNESPVFKLTVNAGATDSLTSIETDYQGFVVLISEGLATGDGKFANNGWLQENPHPVSKVTWDNYAAVSYKTSKEFNIKTGDVLEIRSDNRSLKIPALIQPGLADNFISIESGYGRNNSSVVANGVGYNANVLLSKSFTVNPWMFASVSVSVTGEFRQIVSTQDHHAFDDEMIADQHLKRNIIREATVAQYMKDPHVIHHGGHELHTLYEDHEYPEVKWAMSIDLNKCTGCGQCVVACNSENNIPIVGKDQVATGREMQWIKIDRYYSGSPENPSAKLQPMLCQHCDNAPCENVCPVVATTHSPDGLNQMIYNRCVGTRYCANNCPYKVRRFNFFNFREHFADGFQSSPSFELIANPEVTVRSRGVMEKCTFCIQRISDARMIAATEGRKIKGDDVTTACQESCGTEAIVFGDMNDKESKVSKLREHNLGYHLLEELNTRPNVTYIAKLTNTYSEEV
ncbi:MAG: hypothetical protein AMXMBFR48_05890 [Ignavibacteriales bacterium]